MTPTRWLLRKFRHIDKNRMKKHVDRIAAESGRSRLYILTDMAVNLLLYGISYTDYFRGDYIHLNAKEKSTFCTAKKFYKLMHYLNDQRYIGVLCDKLQFNAFFRPYLGRDFMDLRSASKEDFAEFLNKKKTVFAKILNGEDGQGINAIDTEDVSDPNALYDELLKKGQYLVEDAILQCRELNDYNPHAVHTLRVVTLYKDGCAHVIANNMRIMLNDARVIGSNNLYFMFKEDGTIDGNVIDGYGNPYTAHPLTGKEFAGLRIADFPQACQMCIEAAEKLPQVRYIGWDVAFGVNGPVLIEGNDFPAYGSYQFYKYNGSRIGHLVQIANVLGDEMKQIGL